MKDDTLYINQIMDSIRKIELYIGDFSKEDYLGDEKTQSALLLQLFLIGETAKKISEETKSSIQIPWKQIVGFRDRAIHNYFDIDLDVVWNTIVTDIPELKQAISTSEFVGEVAPQNPEVLP